ncbi:MAG: hypothetical protein JJ895_14375 [Balneolaceae bacterium]|nr:hypothetical protein [Balneolaceae bacterium]
MKFFTLGLLLIVGAACSSTPSGTAESDPEVLILGSWVVSNAQVDGSSYPITTPGFGQIEANFESDLFTYIYPEVGSNGMPNGRTDTLYANWSFNAAFDTLSFTYLNSSEFVFIWHVKELQVGRLSTDYISRSADNPDQQSKYDINYRLK